MVYVLVELFVWVNIWLVWCKGMVGVNLKVWIGFL